MRRTSLLLALILLLPFASNSQSVVTKSNEDDAVIVVKKSMLIADLQSLEVESAKLDKPLAHALAKVEIADAAWTLDQTWAKKLLRQAYELTFPEESEQAKLREIPAGAAPIPPTDNDRARSGIRYRILAVAGRDKTFASELSQSSVKQLGKFEEHMTYTSLASKAIETGDKEAAGNYILQAVEADPTQANAGFSILNLAGKDRAAADQLILQYIERLRAYPLSMVNQSAIRVHFILRQLVLSSRNANPAREQLSPASPAVFKAYVSYVVTSLSGLEQREPGSVLRLRDFLLAAWTPLKQYAPELTGAFMELENLSRRPGENASLPHKSNEETRKDDYEDRVKDALKSSHPDNLIINSAISRGDFDKAREMIDLLPDGNQKTQLTEMVNMREALSLTAKGNTVEAGILAERLTKAASMMQVYPAIIIKCAAKKNEPCVSNAFYQAVKQLKRADTTPYTPPAGIPASAVAGSKEFDPVLSSLGKLAKAVAPVSEALSMEALDETVQAANRSEIDTGQGRTGFETDIFKMLAPKNELRVLQMAGNLKDPLRQIVALAMIDQWKASELAEKAKALRQKNTANK